jgi:hypothetical protein
MEGNFNIHSYFKKQYLTEGTCGYTPDGKPRSKPASPIKEFVGGTLETRTSELFNKLVPNSGASKTIQGELIRAINKLVYRWYNDGDYFYKGYGAETAGPAHAFLTSSSEIPSSLRSTLNQIFNKAIGASEDGYERLIKLALEKVVDYVESVPEDEYTSLKREMYDYDSEFQDEEEEEDDDYYDEDDPEFEDYY